PLSEGVGKTASRRLSRIMPGTHRSIQSANGIERGTLPFHAPVAHACAARGCGQIGINSAASEVAIKTQPARSARLQISSWSATLFIMYPYLDRPSRVRMEESSSSDICHVISIPHACAVVCGGRHPADPHAHSRIHFLL